MTIDLPSRCRSMLSLMVTLTMAIGLDGVLLPSQSEQICVVDDVVEICQASFEKQVLILKRSDGSILKIRTLGRCPSDRPEDGSPKRCNVRISLPSDFVYGLQVIHPSGDLEVIAPTLSIRINGLFEPML